MNKKITPLEALYKLEKDYLIIVRDEYNIIEKSLKALEIIKECFKLNGFDELIPNSKWFESEEKQKFLKEVLL